MRVGITLRCTKCNEENYRVMKNKKTHPDRIEVQKYCPKCNAKTLHKEKNN
ncbi:50S ribosomal protein L33 [Mycoplasma sp. (ex Biomphalaria glabrata)]|uniref:50S ribosomal protein L33 n=1 Tax=Mycoplasma sp. (ex Biomphalaria glabrata) TaxID=1749074 RepID=UPI00073A615F|nr:50S ribosomal protein L33 [Mycoplasma sp. (ex Biomphalaria glabrata)]ALV23594.1 50S ribosomal protein L33 [Mycoplasma sp. (ex Biomphalaria glabrata)]